MELDAVHAWDRLGRVVRHTEAAQRDTTIHRRSHQVPIRQSFSMATLLDPLVPGADSHARIYFPGGYAKGPWYAASNPFNQAGNAGSPVFVFALSADTQGDPDYAIIQAPLTTINLCDGVGFDDATGSWIRRYRSVAVMAVGDEGEIDPYIQGAPCTIGADDPRVAPSVSVSCAPSDPVAGQSVDLYAEVTGSEGAVAPGGSVAFYVNGSLAGGGNIEDGAAGATVDLPASGSVRIVAVYGGDNSYHQARDEISPSITAATTTSRVELLSQNPSVYGSAVRCRVAVQAEDPCLRAPVGSVELYDNDDGTSFGTFAVAPTSGQTSEAFFEIPVEGWNDFLDALDYSLGATFTPSDDSVFSSSDSDGTDLTISASETSVSLHPSDNGITTSERVDLVAYVACENNSSLYPLGNVAFSVDGRTVGTAAVSGGRATLGPVGPFARGVHNVTARFTPRDGNTRGSDSGTAQLTVN